MTSIARSSLILCATFFFVFGLHGQQTCSEETKLLLSPTQVQTAILAFQAHKETHGRIYFFDTPALDLLSRGVILRLREGAKSDLTAKLRPASGDNLIDVSSGRQGFKCEVDVNDGIENRSYSVTEKYPAATEPKTGEELFQLLSEQQKKLLQDSRVQIDWKRVRPLAEIQSTSWKIRAKPPLAEMSLELWKWTSGSILEVSTRAAAGDGPATYAALRDLAKSNGLALNTSQQSKTSVALTKITAAHQP